MNRSTRTALDPDVREGARLLWIALFRLAWTQAKFARELSAKLGRPVAPGTVHPWLYGESRPEDDTAREIERLMGEHGQRVPAGTWCELAKPFDLEKERAKPRRGRAASAAA